MAEHTKEEGNIKRQENRRNEQTNASAYKCLKIARSKRFHGVHKENNGKWGPNHVS